jgi:hypothetical protein
MNSKLRFPDQFNNLFDAGGTGVKALQGYAGLETKVNNAKENWAKYGEILGVKWAINENRSFKCHRGAYCYRLSLGG